MVRVQGCGVEFGLQKLLNYRGEIDIEEQDFELKHVEEQVNDLCNMENPRSLHFHSDKNQHISQKTSKINNTWYIKIERKPYSLLGRDQFSCLCLDMVPIYSSGEGCTVSAVRSEASTRQHNVRVPVLYFQIEEAVEVLIRKCCASECQDHVHNDLSSNHEGVRNGPVAPAGRSVSLRFRPEARGASVFQHIRNAKPRAKPNYDPQPERNTPTAPCSQSRHGQNSNVTEPQPERIIPPTPHSQSRHGQNGNLAEPQPERNIPPTPCCQSRHDQSVNVTEGVGFRQPVREIPPMIPCVTSFYPPFVARTLFPLYDPTFGHYCMDRLHNVPVSMPPFHNYEPSNGTADHLPESHSGWSADISPNQCAPPTHAMLASHTMLAGYVIVSNTRLYPYPNVFSGDPTVQASVVSGPHPHFERVF